MITSSLSFSPLPYWWFCNPPVGLSVFGTMGTLTPINSSFTLMWLPLILPRYSSLQSPIT
ncbi:MAG: hypothetical protein LBV23_10985 [Deltaproteobacteria bacterium]|nr:hypothetical protein [Deltaproteobacteria bacterium]